MAHLEHAVVAGRGDPGGDFDVVVKCPKVLDGVDGGDLPLVIVPLP